MHPSALIVIVLVAVLVGAFVVGRRTGRLLIIGPAALVIVALAGWYAWSSLGEPTVWDRASRLDERTLVVAYTGGECEDQRNVDVDEDDASVKITIITRSFAAACSDVGLQRNVRITLDQPLGERRLVDGSCESRRAIGSCGKAAAERKATPG